MDVPGGAAVAGETIDRLAGDWWVLQEGGGHRYATDDVVVAWEGACARPGAMRVLDLGAGVGGVSLLALGMLGADTSLVAVEVQAESARRMRRTVDMNRIHGRVRVIHADLRDPSALRGEAPFDLVLANPPYLPAGSATPPSSRARAIARLELHGDIFDYARAAAAALAPGGRFCFSHAARDVRPARAIEEAGLVLLSQRDVVFREGAAATIAVFVAAHTGVRRDPEPLVVRDRSGERTEAFRRVRRELNMEV